MTHHFSYLAAKEATVGAQNATFAERKATMLQPMVGAASAFEESEGLSPSSE